MPVFIELTTDLFGSTFERTNAAKLEARRAGAEAVRRPLRGLEIKTDTYAILKLIQADGNEIPLLDSGALGGSGKSYSNFLLQSVSETRMEKHQIVETFGESYIYFFGESPRFLDVQAKLLDSLDFNWYAEWWDNYNRYLRGTKSVEMGARTYLFYDDNIVEGYMLMAQSSKTSDTPLEANLTFRLFLTNYNNISLTESDAYPMHAGATAPNVRYFLPLPIVSQEGDTSLAGILRQQQLGFGAASTQLGIGRDIAAQAGIDPLADQFRQGQEGAGALSDFVGMAANTAGSINSVIDAVTGIIGGPKPPTVSPQQYRNIPFRGIIPDNKDEYTRALPGYDQPSLDDGKHGGLKLSDIESLAYKTITAVKSAGALVSNVPGVLNTMGIINTQQKSPTAFSTTSSLGSYHPLPGQ